MAIFFFYQIPHLEHFPITKQDNSSGTDRKTSNVDQRKPLQGFKQEGIFRTKVIILVQILLSD